MTDQQLIANINKKINSATQADRKCGRTNNLTTPAVIDKLFKQSAKCYYCRTRMKMYKWDAYDKKQFTIERIDNARGHYVSNTVIACLKCNTLRHNQMSSEAFKKKCDSDIFWFVTGYNGKTSIV